MDRARPLPEARLPWRSPKARRPPTERFLIYTLQRHEHVQRGFGPSVPRLRWSFRPFALYPEHLSTSNHGEVFGLSGGVADHRSDWLTDIGHALMREDRLRYRDIVGAIEMRTDRFHIAEESRGYDRHFRRRVHGEDAATRDRAAQEAQYAGALGKVG